MANNDRNTSAFTLNPTDRKFVRMDVNKASPDIKAVLDKLVGQRFARPTTPSGNRPLQVPAHGYMKQISDMTAERINDSESLFQMLPDTELSMQILISSIISPKDMVNTDVTYTVETGSMETELVGAMLKVVEEYFDKTYKIKKLLTPILQDVLFMTGSYPLLILPENTIDEAINSPSRVSVESLRGDINSSGNVNMMGFLGPRTVVKSNATASLESIYGTSLPHQVKTEFDNRVYATKGEHPKDLLIEVSDNPSILKLPILREKVRQDRIQDILSMGHTTLRGNGGSIGMEARGKELPNTSQVEASLYKKRLYKNVPVFNMVASKDLEKPPVGHPMVMKIPSESVIPVHVPSNPDEHIGYYIMIDELGNPVSKAASSDYYSDLSANINSNRDMVSSIISNTKIAEQGRQAFDKEHEASIVQAYTDLVEEDLLARLRNGVYGDDVEISRPTEVYRVMLARSLAQMHTKLLYVPAELMTYIAFDYNHYGVGQSLLDKSRILGSIRAVMLFASTMAMIKNSVARENLNITLDANDKNPAGTVEFLVQEYGKLRSGGFPVGTINPVAIQRHLQNAGVSIAVNGNTGYPETKLEVEDKASSKTKPDNDLMEELKNQHIMSMGLSPETVNMGGNAEFATTIVSSNLLLTKRVIQYQEKLTDFLQDHIQKYIMYSGYLMDALREVVRENKASVAKAEKDARQKAKDSAKAMKDGQKPPAPTPTDDTAETDTDTSQGNPDSSSDGDNDDIDDLGSLESYKDGKTTPDRSKNEGARHITDKDKDINSRKGEDAIIMEFIHALKVALPSPDTVSLENQMKSYTAYSDALDVVIKAYMDSSFLDETTMGDLSASVEATIGVTKSYFLRQFLRTNNIMKELDILTNMGADGEAFDLLEMQEGHMEGLMLSVGDFMKNIKARLDEKAAADAAEAAANAAAGVLPDGSLGDIPDGTETPPDGSTPPADGTDDSLHSDLGDLASGTDTSAKPDDDTSTVDKDDAEVDADEKDNAAEAADNADTTADNTAAAKAGDDATTDDDELVDELGADGKPTGKKIPKKKPDVNDDDDVV